MRWISTLAAPNRYVRNSRSPHRETRPVRSSSPDCLRRGVRPRKAPTLVAHLKRDGCLRKIFAPYFGHCGSSSRNDPQKPTLVKESRKRYIMQLLRRGNGLAVATAFLLITTIASGWSTISTMPGASLLVAVGWPCCWHGLHALPARGSRLRKCNLTCGRIIAASNPNCGVSAMCGLQSGTIGWIAVTVGMVLNVLLATSAISMPADRLKRQRAI